MGACSCGHDLAESDRYCPQCGSPAAPVAHDGPSFVTATGSPDTDGALLLSGTSKPETSESSSEVRSGLRGPWLLAGGVAVIALLWALFAWPKDETPVEGTGQQIEESDEAAESTSSTSPSRSTAAAGSDEDDEDSDEEDSDEDADSDADAEAKQQRIAGSESGPLLGEPTGLSLVVGNYNGSSIELIDLDSGIVHDLEVRGAPVGGFGNTLVIDSTNGSVLVTDLTSPSDQPVVIGSSVPGWTGFVGVEDELIWVSMSDGPGIPELRGFDATGEQRRTMDSGFVPFFWGWSGHSDLIYNSAGGIYEGTGDSLRRVAPGLLRAAGDTIALVHQCDERMSCESVWLDRERWEPLGYPAPAYNPQVAQALVVGNDRWLVETDWADQATTISDVQTGEIVRESSGFNQNSPLTVPAISEDGRWLFESIGAAEVIIDLTTGREWELELARSFDVTAVFLNLDGTPFDAE